jgi:hypothetical protein
MGIEEGEEVQATGRENILKKVIADDFLNPVKEMPIQVRRSLSL